MRDYWVNGKQVTGFIGSLFVIFSIFLPLYAVNLPVLGQVPVALIYIPFVGVPIAIILVILGILSILALVFEEYKVLYLTGFVTLFITLAMFVITELGLVFIAGNLPGFVSAAINYLFDYDFGWIVLIAGSGFLIAAPKM